MNENPLWTVESKRDDGMLRAMEPTRSEIVLASPRLAAFYNDGHNRAMLAHAGEMSPDEVIDHYDNLHADGSRPFLLLHNGMLAGDADFRKIRGDTAEFAILIGNRPIQGRGFGTRFAVMLHLFAFKFLRLARVYVSIIPDNRPSRRLFEKLGYQIDDSPRARAAIDDAGDITMSIDRDLFEAAMHAHDGVADRDIRWFERTETPTRLGVEPA